ncbi:hypothetical protein VDGD_21177 [Verticillium dahliae]|nr:hypothetical protein VDGD_21177 [Verticillium dahliae]
MWPGPLQVEWKSSPWRDMGGHCRAGMGLGETLKRALKQALKQALKLPERGALGMPPETAVGASPLAPVRSLLRGLTNLLVRLPAPSDLRLLGGTYKEDPTLQRASFDATAFAPQHHSSPAFSIVSPLFHSHDAATKGGQTCQHQGLAVPPPSEGPPEAPEAPEAFFLDAFDTHQCTPAWLFFHPSILPTSQRLPVK